MSRAATDTASGLATGMLTCEASGSERCSPCGAPSALAAKSRSLPAICSRTSSSDRNTGCKESTPVPLRTISGTSGRAPPSRSSSNTSSRLPPSRNPVQNFGAHALVVVPARLKRCGRGVWHGSGSLPVRGWCEHGSRRRGICRGAPGATLGSTGLERAHPSPRPSSPGSCTDSAPGEPIPPAGGLSRRRDASIPVRGGRGGGGPATRCWQSARAESRRATAGAGGCPAPAAPPTHLRRGGCARPAGTRA